jgi:hypothetical protein
MGIVRRMEELPAVNSAGDDRATLPTGQPSRPAVPPSVPPPKPTYRSSSDAWLALVRHRTLREAHA